MVVVDNGSLNPDRASKDLSYVVHTFFRFLSIYSSLSFVLFFLRFGNKLPCQTGILFMEREYEIRWPRSYSFVVFRLSTFGEGLGLVAPQYVKAVA